MQYIHSQSLGKMLAELERENATQLRRYLMIERSIWKLKSRVNWMKDGDASTKYFHAAVRMRRSRNTIAALRTDQGIIQ